MAFFMSEPQDERNFVIGWQFFSISGELLILDGASIPDYDNSADLPWKCFIDEIRSITFARGNTRVGSYWFSGCKNLESVHLTSTITSIGANAFNLCPCLSSINIPKSIVAIGEYAFYGCENLGFVDLPEGLRSIGEWAFHGCKQLTFHFLPSTVKSIGEVAFYGCKRLRCIVIPEGVETLESSVFRVCELLEKVELPSTVKVIKESAFVDCPNLKYVTLSNLTEIIECVCFCRCHQLENIDLPDSIVEIQSLSFSETSLRSVILPCRLQKIENRLFRGCPNLQSVVIPDSVTVIEEEAFFNCPSLRTIAMPQSITFIGKKAFEGCISLAIISIPNGVTKIKKETFKDCISLVNVGIPPSVVCIGRCAFLNCGQLILDSIPNSIQKIKEDAFLGCIDSVTSVDANDDIRHALNGACGEAVFWSYDPNSRSLSITGEGPIEDTPESWTHLKYYTETVEISDGITRIGARAFRGFKALASISIGVDVSSIGADAFYGCVSLSSFYCYRPRYFSFEHGMLFSADKRELIYFPSRECTLNIPAETREIRRGLFNDFRRLFSIKVDKNNRSFREFDNCLFSNDLSTLIYIPPFRNSLCCIPQYTVNITEDALKNCNDLEMFEVAYENGAYTVVDGVLFTKDLKTLIRYPPKKEGICFIPGPTTAIADGALLGCESIHLFEVAEENQALTSFDGVLFSKDLTRLIAYPFKGEDDFTIPKETVELDEHAFVADIQLRNIEVDERNQVFSAYHGSLFSKDRSVLIRVFGHLEIPKETSAIDTNAFVAAPKLVEIEVSPENPFFVTDGRHLLTKDKQILLYSPFSSSVVIPDEFAAYGPPFYVV